jgi:hypothetical protein
MHTQLDDLLPNLYPWDVDHSLDFLDFCFASGGGGASRIF